MSRIDKLIEELCPEGVEWKKLSKVAVIGTGSSNGNEAIDNGKYPFFVRSKIVKRLDKFEFDEEAIIIPGEGGIGEIFHYINGKYALHQRAYRIHVGSDKILTKFLYYYMMSNFKEFILLKAVNATVTSIRKPMIENFSIPIPPIPIQQEIVRILDSFTDLDAELQAELESRKKQYEYYREQLLNFEGKDLLKIGEFAELIAGATPKTSVAEYWNNGTIPWMSSGEVNKGKIYTTEKKISKIGYDKCSTKLIPPDTVVIALAGQGKTRGTVAITKIPLCTNQSLCSIITNEKVNSMYLFYYLQSKYQDLRHISSGDGNRGGLNLKIISNYKIPIPHLSEQEQIVSILDKFETLVNEELPAEIAARRKQYEHYREKLLTFEPFVK